MADLHGKKHYCAVTMGLVAYLDERRVEMQIVTATGENVILAFAKDSILRVEQHIARMARDCPEIATWGDRSAHRPTERLNPLQQAAAASERERGTHRPSALRALMSGLLLVLALLAGGPAAAAEPQALAVAQAEQFPFQPWAQKHCPADTVVWVNMRSQVYNSRGELWYGQTNGGAFVCKSEAEKAGYHAKPES